MPKIKDSPRDSGELPDEALETRIILPPDGGWGWVVVGAALAINFVADGLMMSFGLFIDEIAADLGTTTGAVTWAGSVMTSFYYLFGPVVCASINRLGYRIVGFIGGVLLVAGFVLASFADDVPQLISTYGLLGGIGFGMVYMPGVIAVGYYFDRWRGMASSLSLVGSAAGPVLVPQIVLVLLQDFTWRKKLLIISGAGGLCGIMTLLYKPLRPVSIYNEEGDDEVIANTMLNKYHNQSFPTLSTAGRSFVSIQRPDLVSQYSYRSIANTAYLPKGSRLWEPKQKIRCGSCRKCSASCTRTWTDLCCCICTHFTAAASRPMYRDDILYTASLKSLPQFKQTESAAYGTLDYHMSVTRAATQKDLEEDEQFCLCCPHSWKRPLLTMLDLSLLKSYGFSCLMASCFLTMFGMYTPIIFITQKCMEAGMEVIYTQYLLSAIGIANLVGRISCTIITVFPKISALYLTTVSLTLCGLAAIISVYFDAVLVQFTFCAIYGFNVATLLSMRPLMIVELFGLEKLSNSFGLMAMFQGLAILCGLPLGGILRDETHSYYIPFWIAGGSLLASAVLLPPIKILLRWEEKPRENATAAGTSKQNKSSKKKDARSK